MGFMSHKKGHNIIPHYHPHIRRETYGTQEVILLKKGRIRVDFYSKNRAFLESREMTSGDWIILLEGGHGFEILEPSIMVEIKNGPYVGLEDKVRFEKN